MVVLASTSLTNGCNSTFVDGVKLQRRMHIFTAETDQELIARNNRGQEGLNFLSLMSTQRNILRNNYIFSINR